MKAMYNEQVAQQRSMYPDWDDPKKRDALSFEFGAHLNGAVHDYMRARGFKERIGAHPVQRKGVRLAAFADILKWTLALAATEGWTDAEITKAFWRKTQVVDTRTKFPAFSEWPDKVVSFDLDGVLAEYAKGWGDKFIEADGPLETNAHAPGIDLADRFIEDGWGMVVTTSRPLDRWPEIEWQTYEWLKHWGFNPLLVIFAHDKNEALKPYRDKVRLHIDDRAKHALDTGGIWYAQQLADSPELPDGIETVSSLSDVIPELCLERSLS